MSELTYRIYQCLRPTCRYRFPLGPGIEAPPRCPKCAGPLRLSHVADAGLKNETSEPPPPGIALEVLLDNIRSTFNVGAMFRTADGAGVRHVHLCGTTPTPDHPKVVKTALGAEFTVPWTQHWNALDAVQSIQARGLQVWALESAPGATSLYETHPLPQDPPVLLVVGNEVTGVDPEILPLCDRILRIPMQGYKRSLNVAIAFAIAVYHLRYTSG
ncbi:MAG: RNA methyltransferase [Chloroflexi bacterium]|nr:RNA methyltransferase [Anaerolineaceae bacterium]NMB87132.1 RNA methyltransferase [Chloroflexota bacterium]